MINILYFNKPRNIFATQWVVPNTYTRTRLSGFSATWFCSNGFRYIAQQSRTVVAISLLLNMVCASIWSRKMSVLYLHICIYYCVEMVKIENNSHMIEIMCKVAFLRFFKHFWHSLA